MFEANVVIIVRQGEDIVLEVFSDLQCVLDKSENTKISNGLGLIQRHGLPTCQKGGRIVAIPETLVNSRDHTQGYAQGHS